MCGEERVTGCVVRREWPGVWWGESGRVCGEERVTGCVVRREWPGVWWGESGQKVDQSIHEQLDAKEQWLT